VQPIKKRFGPNRVLTGTGRRACDGLEVELQFKSNDGQVSLTGVRILEVHDINSAEKRAEREVAWFLKKCIGLIKAEGLTLIDNEQVYYVTADQVVVGKIRYQQFCTPSTRWGPFSTGRRP